MERLITDAEALDSSFKATRDSNGDLAMSYADIVDAIQIVQDNMGITGTTAEEAEKTISGSLAMMKSSWDNLLTAMASGEGFKTQMDALVSSASSALNNILPVIENFLVGFGDLMKQVGPIIVEKLPEIIEEVMPSLLDAAVQIVGALAEALPGILQAVVTVFGSLVDSISDYLNERWPTVGKTFDAIVGFAQTAFNGIISFLKKVFSGDWEGAWNDLKTAVQNIKWSEIGEKVKTAVGAAWSTLREWAGKLWEKAKTGIQSVNWAEIGGKVKDAISGAWDALKGWATGIWNSAKAGIEAVNWGAVGNTVLQWFGAAWSQLKTWAQNLWESAKAGIEAVNWKDIGDAIWKAVKEGIGSLVDNMKTLFETGATGIKNVDWKTVGSDIWDLIKSGLEALGAGIVSLFTDAKDEVGGGESIDWSGLGSSIVDLIIEGFKGIGGLILGLFEAVWNDIQNIPWAGLGLVIANYVLDGLGPFGDWLRDKFDIARVSLEDLDWSGTGKEAASQVVDGMSGLPDDVSGIGERAANGFGGGRGGGGSTLGGGAGRNNNVWTRTADTIRGFLRDGISHITTDVSSTADKAASNFGGASGGGGGASRWSGAGRNAGNSVTEAFKAAALKAIDAVTQIQNAINGIQGKAVTVQINKTTYETTVSKGARSKTTSYSPNARAMDTGYIFRHPTVFAYADNAFQVAGDVGPEAVVGVYSLDNMIQNSVNAAVGRTQAAMVGVLSEILDKMPKGQLVLDTGALVGGIAPEMNDELERITAWSGGGRA